MQLLLPFNYSPVCKSLDTQLDAVVHFFEKMDAEMVDLLLPDLLYLQDMKKAVFIAKLDIAFNRFKQYGNSYLEAYNGRCKGCNCLQKGFRFVGENSRNYMDILFLNHNGTITDIYECHDFALSESIPGCLEKIVINEHRYDFDYPPEIF